MTNKRLAVINRWKTESEMNSFRTHTQTISLSLFLSLVLYYHFITIRRQSLSMGVTKRKWRHDNLFSSANSKAMTIRTAFSRVVQQTSSCFWSGENLKHRKKKFKSQFSVLENEKATADLGRTQRVLLSYFKEK